MEDEKQDPTPNESVLRFDSVYPSAVDIFVPVSASRKSDDESEEEMWQATFKATENMLIEMGTKALEEHRKGLTRPLGRHAKK